MKKRVLSLVAMVLVIIMATLPVAAQEYVVKEGDVLWKIAEKLNVSVVDLENTNGLTDPNRIYPGQVLSTETQVETMTERVPKYVFMFIGDGLGASQRQISEYFLQTRENDSTAKLLMNTFPVAGINTTYSADSYITDSAAAGTALATGIKTNNGMIAMNPDGYDLKTLVECAEEAGMATGLATTTRLTHATPAAFGSHEVSRNNENEIAADYLESGIDFLAGGGIRHFIGADVTGTDAIGATYKSKRTDERDLVDEFEAAGYDTYIGMDGANAFETASFEEGDQVLALFTYTHMPYEVDRMNMYKDAPSIAQMTAAGIELLSQDEDGFFFMIEGGRIDHASHANDVAGTVYDTLAFDDAIAEAYDFYLEHPTETLILVVGDHETGGLGLGMDTQGYFVDMSGLSDVKVSIEDTMMYGAGAYTGDHDAFATYVSNTMGLGTLTTEEAAKLENGMIASDQGETYGYYAYNSAAMAAAQIVSERMNINWTTTIHTATAIPMSAIGVESEVFGGYKDNTEIALAVAKVLGFELNQ